MKINNLSIINLLLSAIIVVLIFSSCSKEESTNINQVSDYHMNDDLFSHVTLKNGALCFDSAKYVSMIAMSLHEMSFALRKNWEVKMGFKSMYSCIDEVHDLLANCESEDEYYAILNKNNDILKLNGEDIDQIIPLDYHTAIINREGIYYVNKAVVKITPTSKIIVWSGDKTKLDLQDIDLKSTITEENNGMRIIADDVVIFDYMDTTMLKSWDIGNDLYGDREHDKRKIKFWIRSWRESWANHSCDYYHRWFWEIKVSNWKKTIGWHKYNTTCKWEGVDITMNFPYRLSPSYRICGDVYYVLYDPYYYSPFDLRYHYKISGIEVKDMIMYYWYGETIRNNYLPLPSITWARGRATNRGIGDRFAGICYNTSNCHNLN